MKSNPTSLTPRKRDFIAKAISSTKWIYSAKADLVEKTKKSYQFLGLFLVGMKHSPTAKQDSVCEANIGDWNLTKKEKDA